MPTNSIGQDLLNVPFGEMVRNLGNAIADAQYALDSSSLKIAQLMAGYRIDDSGNAVRDGAGFVKLGTTEYPLLLLGFTPTFYQFVETIIEVKMEISMHESTDDSTQTRDRKVDRDKGILTTLVKGHKSHVTTVTAKHSQKYSYSAEGSSLIRTKLVPIPPPAALQQICAEIAKSLKGTAEGEAVSGKIDTAVGNVT
ncbi:MULTISPECIES: hypothetical protein [unclassified Corallococcus]|uniref:hypothetical protein n=1 Tax=unclassified Corallococcus TaxID=2685029 RepID=UPI0018F4C986|nr:MULTISPECIES: hypothetical protein [unclassified Corallococcus]